jgi:putative NADH-flavin reductase
MRILVLGATGRVGSEIVRLAHEAGHTVTAFVRDPKKLRAPADVKVVVGDLSTANDLTAALSTGVDALLNAIGADPLKPSTLVTDTARIAIAAMQAAGVRRYIAVSGTANMPRKTFFGKLVAAFFSITPVGNAIRDHKGAFALVQASNLDWTLSGCPYIKDATTQPGPASYGESDVFTGGFSTVTPTNVARFLVKTIDDPSYIHRIVFIWNR